MSWQGRGADPTGSVLLHGEDRIGVSDAVQGATYGAAAGGCEKCGLVQAAACRFSFKEKNSPGRRVYSEPARGCSRRKLLSFELTVRNRVNPHFSQPPATAPYVAPWTASETPIRSSMCRSTHRFAALVGSAPLPFQDTMRPPGGSRGEDTAAPRDGVCEKCGLTRISHRNLLRHRMSRPGLRQSHRSDPHCAGSTAPVGSASLPCQDTTYGTSRRCL